MVKKKEIIAMICDNHGNTISLIGGGQKWSIYEEIDGRITMTSMPKELAKKEYNKKRKLRKPL